MKEFSKLGHDIANVQIFKQVLIIAGEPETTLKEFTKLHTKIDMDVLDKFLRKYGH